MPEHAFPLVREVLETLRSAGLDAWLFGGWAGEVRGMRPPGAHADIDLLLRAADFAALEALLAGRAGVAEILEKRFSHKRAYEWGGVRVELFLVEDGPSQRTVMFDRRAVVQWPPDTFTEALVDGLPVASKSALALYRRDHKQVVRACLCSISRAGRSGVAGMMPSRYREVPPAVQRGTVAARTRPITHEDLACLPGLRRAAAAAPRGLPAGHRARGPPTSRRGTEDHQAAPGARADHRPARRAAGDEACGVRAAPWL